MLLRCILSSLLLVTSFLPFAETITSQTPQAKTESLVNSNIQRLAIPPTPNNISLPAFGQGVIGWGTGPDGAETRLNNITQDEVNQLKTQNVTLELVESWQKFYENETQRNPGNPTAPFRAKLMKKIVDLW